MLYKVVKVNVPISDGKGRVLGLQNLPCFCPKYVWHGRANKISISDGVCKWEHFLWLPLLQYLLYEYNKIFVKVDIIKTYSVCQIKNIILYSGLNSCRCGADQKLECSLLKQNAAFLIMPRIIFLVRGVDECVDLLLVGDEGEERLDSAGGCPALHAGLVTEVVQLQQQPVPVHPVCGPTAAGLL